jgi:glycosyltransferase involved in cell wall biosynthesis
VVSQILAVVDEVNFGGAELSFFTLCRALARRCRVHLALYEGSLKNPSIQEWCRSLTNASVTLHTCAQPLYPGARRNLHHWLRRGASRELAELMDELQPDLVIVNLPTVERGQTVLDAARIARRPAPVWGYLHSAHLPTTTGARWRLRDALVPRQLRRFGQHLLTVSATAARDMSRRYGVAPAGILYPPVATAAGPLPPGERASRRAAAGLPEGFLIGTVGRVHFGHKGQDAALRVVARLNAAGCPGHLVVIGDGPDVHALGMLAKQLGIEERVSWLGWRGDAGELTAVLDALVITSRHEGMPLTALEAAAAQVPVVAYAIDGLTELLPAEFTVGYGDEIGLADTLGRLIRGDLDWPNELMSQRARAWSDPELAAEKFLGLIELAPAPLNRGDPSQSTFSKTPTAATRA